MGSRVPGMMVGCAAPSNRRFQTGASKEEDPRARFAGRARKLRLLLCRSRRCLPEPAGQLTPPARRRRRLGRVLALTSVGPQVGRGGKAR